MRHAFANAYSYSYNYSWHTVTHTDVRPGWRTDNNTLRLE
jgi:hypothetical protein